jgi:enoyl-CoA hydratase
MTQALDRAFQKAVQDDAVACIILRGSGKHFSAGHDIGTDQRDIDQPFEKQATLWYDHMDRPGAEGPYVRESEAYLGMCRRWRAIPKPTIAAVHGACIAGGLMLAWACDLIVATEGAFFSDPVVKMGIPGVEFFAHPFVMRPRQAKEFLFLGERMSAADAWRVGMINRVVAADALEDTVQAMAVRLASRPRFALALAKQAINQAEDRMGQRDVMDATYGLHHLAHAHNALTTGDPIAGMDARKMKEG